MGGSDGGSTGKITYTPEQLSWLYEELIRVERHWTEQVRDQQSRISTLLSVSGILLGFLTGAGFLAKLLDVQVRQWPVYLYVLSLVSLCFALFMGIRALRPAIPVEGTPHPERVELGTLFESVAEAVKSFRPARMRPTTLPDWLNQEQILKDASSLCQEDLLRKLCGSAAENQARARHPDRLRERRQLMLRQFTFVVLSLGFLIGALAGVLLAKPETKTETCALHCPGNVSLAR